MGVCIQKSSSRSGTLVLAQMAWLFMPHSAGNPAVRLSAALRSMRCTRATRGGTHTFKKCLKYSEWMRYLLERVIMIHNRKDKAGYILLIVREKIKTKRLTLTLPNKG